MCDNQADWSYDSNGTLKYICELCFDSQYRSKGIRLAILKGKYRSKGIRLAILKGKYWLDPNKKCGDIEGGDHALAIHVWGDILGLKK